MVDDWPRNLSLAYKTHTHSYTHLHTHSLSHSATWPPEVRRLTQSYMKNPYQVSVGSLDLRVSNLLSCTLTHTHTHTHTPSHMYLGSSPTRGSSLFVTKSDCLGCAVLLCLVICLTLLASFFLLISLKLYIHKCTLVHIHVHVHASHLSLKHVYT